MTHANDASSPPAADANRRARTRVAGHFVAALDIGGQRLACETEDLSLKGMRCKTLEPIDPERLPLAGNDADAACRVFLSLAGGPTLEIEATFVRAVCDDGCQGLALTFTGMDPDAYTHLKNIVRYNTQGDPDAVEDEEAVPLDP